MKQATQLPIPFDLDDGRADITPSTVRGAGKAHFLSFDDAELHALAAVRLAAKTVLPSLLLAAQAAAFVAFGFALMFFSAITGG